MRVPCKPMRILGFDHEHILCDGMHEYTEIIDNSTNPYFSVQLECGVTVYCAPNVFSQCPSVLGDLESDLMDCLNLLPRNLHRLIRRTRVWVNSSYQYGPRNSPMVVNHTTAHHHPGWLAWAHDRLDKTYEIEIYNCYDYRRMRLHWNGCGLVLHELCHLIHQFALADGLENKPVMEAYETARASGLYANVRRRDWAGKRRGL
ncbi:hypothetical protein MPSEU_001091800 [Mayamaea pseudoterrestris]|nr:hypothetical protein MPSEU_001091800 [Mayamaea pseudoterrestris]